MSFCETPIANSPYAYPSRHWKLDADGQPTNWLLQQRRQSDLIKTMPKPKKCRAGERQSEIAFDEPANPSSAEQAHERTPIIGELRGYVDRWRAQPSRQQRQVTPETVRLLRHWRHHASQRVRSFFCQPAALQAAI
jgi:type III restriction enzyme